MKTNLTYQATDLREPLNIPTGEPVKLHPVPGGLMVFVDGDARDVLQYDDDDPDAFIDHEEEGTVIVTTAQGSVMFKVMEG